MNSVKEVLNGWYERVTNAQKAHYLSTNHFTRWSMGLGIPVIALSAIVGTSIFFALQNRPEPCVQILVGLCSLTATVLASLQTFLGHSERAEKHRVAGAKYGALCRELEI
jgi:hypothetical protein